MALEIRSNQIRLADSFAFSGTITVPTPSADSQAATKAYVDSNVQVLSAGDGIDITSSVVSVDLATDAGLLFIGAGSDELAVKVKSEAGGSITRDADGIYIADNAIGNAKLAGSIANDKLANSTISGKALGTNLDSLSAGNGLALASPYNGSAAQTLSFQFDGGSLSASASGVKVADGGVDTAQLADAAVDISKISFGFVYEGFNGNGSATTFDLSKAIYHEDGVQVSVNGQMLERVAASAGAGQYSVSRTGGAGGVTQITIGGTAKDSNDRILAVYLD